MTLSPDEYIEYSLKQALEYFEGVVSGSIITSENIKLATKRYAQDYKSELYDWNEDAVKKVYRFFSYVFLGPNKQFELSPYQAFIIFTTFGFYLKGTDTRKYQNIFLFIARKNGKTTFSAALQLYLMLKDGAEEPESLLILGAKDQTEETSFTKIKTILYYSPELRKRLIVNDSGMTIRFKKTFRDGLRRPGLIKVMSSIPKKTEGLNPTSAILDEIHTYKDGKLISVINNALGTKKNPLIFLVSTAGEGKNSYCAQLVEAGRNVLRGIISDERTAYFLYELDEGDNWLDEKNWIKANPGLGTILHKDALSEKWEKAKRIEQDIREFQYKSLNIFVDENIMPIPKKKIVDCQREFTDDEIKDLPCYIGVDLSEVNDLTNVNLLWDGGEKIYVKSYFFFVDQGSNVLRKGKINIRDWVDKGHVIKCGTQIIDTNLIKSYLFEFSTKYNVKGLFFDPYHFKPFLILTQGEKSGWLIPDDPNQNSILCTPVVGYTKFHWPYRFMESKIHDRTIVLYPNPCLVWNFTNIILEEDRHSNILLRKNENKDPIDGVIGLLNSIYGYMGIGDDKVTRFFKNS